jgi:N-acetylglucosamine-6-phosphate deacetylase
MTREVLTGSVVASDGRLREARVVIDGCRIWDLEIGGPGDGETIIAPGLIDLQVNGYGGRDAAEGPDAIAAISERLPSTGVTGFVPTLISRPLAEGRAFVEFVAEAPAAGARVLGAQLEGPFLNPEFRGAHDEACLQLPTTARVERVLEHPPRMITIAPELEGGVEAVRAFAGAGVLVSVGHSGATYEQARAAFDAGARFVNHLFNAMPALHHRSPGVVGAVLDDERVTTGVIADNVHVHPSLVRVAGRAKGTRGLALTTDQVAAAGVPPGRYLLSGREVTKTADGSVRLADGTLAGSAATMNLLVRNAAGLFGLHAALAMASRTPAGVLGLSRLGRIAPGCDADLVVLTSELCVRRTIVAGRTVYAA